MPGKSQKSSTAIRCGWLLIALASSSGWSQQPAPNSATSGASELPVIMRQSITAGKTPVGTPVQAELVIATMVNGAVVPRGAILAGEVVQSVAKSKTELSRLSIRIDSAKWKNGSAPVKVYLTAWYYPEAAMTGQDLSYQPLDATNSKRTWNGQGTYPDPGNPISQEKFPGRDSEKGPDNGTPPAYRLSKHRTLLKHVESARSSDGVVTLSSSSQNIKIDRLTTYVLSTGDLMPVN